MLNKRLRKRVRRIARDAYIPQSGSKDWIKKRATEVATSKLKTEFGSGILTSILISLMIKLAIRYVEEWLEDELFGYNVPFQFEEVRKKK